MADKHTETFEIAIIGLGPVGATLANLLGQMGVSTVVLESVSYTHLTLPTIYSV